MIDNVCLLLNLSHCYAPICLGVWGLIYKGKLKTTKNTKCLHKKLNKYIFNSSKIKQRFTKKNGSLLLQLYLN